MEILLDQVFKNGSQKEEIWRGGIVVVFPNQVIILLVPIDLF